MSSDPWFLAVAAVTMLVVGLSKSGFLAGLGVLGVPLLSLVMPPVQAAAILLPILIASDVISVWAYRKTFDRANLVTLLPAATAGIGIGWLTAAYVTDAAVRLIVGAIAVLFTLDYALKLRPVSGTAPGAASGWLWGTLAGFTSFVSHAGAPPYQIYVMPQRLSPEIYAGTTVIFFAVVNVIKLVPYFALGQFDSTNLKLSLALTPLAIAGVFTGIWLVRRIPVEPFYRIAYGLLALVGVKLLYDGVRGTFGL